MPKTLLITLPEHELLIKYVSAWSSKIVDCAKKANFEVIELHRDKAEKKEVAGRMKKLEPELVVLNGHGNEICIAGHDDHPILEEGDKFFPARVIYARACRAAKSLGKKLVSSGILAFIGYDEDFIMRMDKENIQRPLENKVAELYMIPSNYVSIALIKGYTAKEANEKSIGLYKKTIEKLWLEGSRSDYYEEIKFLYWDMTHQVCLGNPAVKL